MVSHKKKIKECTMIVSCGMNYLVIPYIELFELLGKDLFRMIKLYKTKIRMSAGMIMFNKTDIIRRLLNRFK